MQEHSHIKPETTSPRSLPPEKRAGTVRLEAYLDQVLTPLKKQLSEEALAERRAEMRKQLEDLTAAHEELGATPEQAVERAVEQFGRSQSVSLQHQRERERTVSSVSVQPATRTALRYFGLATLITTGALFLSGEYINYSSGNNLML